VGYDDFIVTGNSEVPVYLWIEDDHVEIRDAPHLWATGVIGTQHQLLSQLGSDVRAWPSGRPTPVRCPATGEVRRRVGNPDPPRVWSPYVHIGQSLAAPHLISVMASGP
jgi:hypothetical protein